MNSKKSIKGKVTRHFILTYLLICFLTVLIMISGFTIYYFHSYYKQGESIVKIAQQENLQDVEDLIMYLEAYKSSLPYNIHTINKEDSLMIFDAHAEGIIQKFIIDKKYGLALFAFRVPNDTKYEYVLSLDHTYLKQYYNYTIGFLVLLIVSFIIGLIIIWITSYKATSHFSKTISKMNEIVENISIANVDELIDINTIEYEMKDLALNLNDTLLRLKKDYNNQKKFVSDVSHELRTPVSVIDGYANLLNRWGKEDEEVLNESVEAILNESKYMSELIQELLFLARRDNKSHRYTIENFYMDQLLIEVIKETKVIDGEHEIYSQIQSQVIYNGDRKCIKQALRVFVDNAIKYTPKNGKIHLALSNTQEGLEIVVEDTGRGIEKEDLNHIFNRFYRADESRNREAGGNGLGLAIAKVIIVDHSGRIKVKSKVDKGSAFSIYLPHQINYKKMQLFNQIDIVK